MQPGAFKLERYFARYEFNVAYVLCASDPESLMLRDLLDMAGPEAMNLWEGLSLGYTESQGHPLLREEIARLYANLAPDDVLVAAPEEAIFLAMQALLQPGDEVIAIAPAYQSLHEVARALGCRIKLWHLSVRDGAWFLDTEALAAAVTEQTRLIIVNFPHNPTGYLPSAAEQGAIIDLAWAHNAYLFSDEMYWGLEYDPAQRLPPACDLYERAVTLHGLSKSLALPGLRIGWLATQDRDFLEAAARWKDYTTICSSAPSEILAIMALQARAAILARNLALIQANRLLAEDFCRSHASTFTWLPPQAGSVAFPALTAGWPADRFCDDLRASQGVLLAPASVFDYPGNHVRFGLGRANFARGLDRLGAFLESA